METIEQLRRERDDLLKECAELRTEDRAWREIVVLLIKQLPLPVRSLVCANVAQLPAFRRTLTPEHKAQARLILEVAKGNHGHD